MAEITSRAVHPPVAIADAPAARGSLQFELRRAVAAGRIRDPAANSFRPRMRFDSRKLTDPPRWTNGLIYSQWQLLAVPDLRPRLVLRRNLGSYERRRVVLPPLDEWATPQADKVTRWALVLTALEARYMPTIDREWLQLTNVEVEEWHEYRALYDSAAVAESLDITPEETRACAEWLLHRAHSLDPTGDWSRLIRRAPRRAWKTLTGDALVALNHRLAAEVLLLFYEDLASRRKAAPLPDLPGMVWHPLHDRISAGRDEELDTLLAHLGVSPHPGVLVVVEGETEERMVQRVFDHLDLRRTPDLVRVLCMRGADRQLPLVAAAAVAPLLGERHGDSYDMIRPPTRLMITVDQDSNWDTAAKIARQRRNIIAEINKVVAAQGGASLSPNDLETLVVVHQWRGRCFEYAHFTDDELADAMVRIHPTCGGLNRSDLIARIAATRAGGGDIKKVWNSAWIPRPSKLDLADALWPTLQAKIDYGRFGESEEIPQVAEVVHDAYLLAQQSTYGTYVIRTADGV